MRAADCFGLPMGCLPSRSTSVSPVESVQSSAQAARQKRRTSAASSGGRRQEANGQLVRPTDNNSDSGTQQLADIGTSFDREEKQLSSSQSLGGEPDEDRMSIPIDEHDLKSPAPTEGEREDTPAGPDENENSDTEDSRGTSDKAPAEGAPDQGGVVAIPTAAGPLALSGDDSETPAGGKPANGKRLDSSETGVSFDDELNMDLLRQYICVDYEIGQLEDRDALRLYHEKIEQLEQLERELDMISFEAEEMAARSEANAGGAGGGGRAPESNSILSGTTVSISPRSSIMQKGGQAGRADGRGAGRQPKTRNRQAIVATYGANGETDGGRHTTGSAATNTISYSTIENIFSRKIILEKERDRLKKEVEMVIVECDRLQQRYKRRDEILDKLFDGRTGNGLENHLEQQLNWLMEQKHYVDQVFYAWKRAETLTSQTCEQFASALELLKRLPRVPDGDERSAMARNVCELLIKSRADMEQAQRYNPNVDAPFFTDAETKRFDQIIASLQSDSVSQMEYNQMATVVQFAYKRAVSIRLWLEQILQITIARDSFELAEEYKWIAIQLRKERISLINSRLQEAPYRAMAQSIREQLGQQQQAARAQLQREQQLAITSGGQSGRRTDASATTGARGDQQLNRDSGIESDDIDIEEDIYRLLEMNKSRLEAAVAASKEAGLLRAPALDPVGRPIQARAGPNGSLKSNQLKVGADSAARDQLIRERIQRRVEQGAASSVPLASMLRNSEGARDAGQTGASSSAASLSTPSKLRVQLDEKSRQNLLKQVEQSHTKHRTRLDNLRGTNKAKASDLLQHKLLRGSNSVSEPLS